MPYENNLPPNGMFHRGQEKYVRPGNESPSLKIDAGAGKVSVGNFHMPPELETEFLKTVLEFERGCRDAEFVSVATLLGNPVYKKAAELSDEALAAALQLLIDLLNAKNISVVFLRPRDPRFMYRFITEELFAQPTENLVMPGMTKCFVYEEFYPDHQLVVEHRTVNILASWFEQSPAAMDIYLGNRFIQPDGQVFTRAEQIKRLKASLSPWTRFEDYDFSISNISILQKSDDPRIEAMGHSEGTMRYVAVKADGAKELIEGPFKFYFTCEYGWWSCFFFYLAGL